MGAESSPMNEPELGSDPEAPSPLESEGTSKNITSLSRELADFLIEFSIVLHKRSMYPAGAQGCMGATWGASATLRSRP